MELKTREIIDALKYSYFINITPLLEMRIEELYNLGKVRGAEDVEKVLSMLFHGEKMLFNERNSFEIVHKWLASVKKQKIKILTVSADRGQSAYSAYILTDLMKVHVSGKQIDVFSINISLKDIERAVKPSYSYDVLMKANANELSYFINKLETFSVKSEAVENIGFINGSYFRMPFKEESFDVVFVEDLYKYFDKSKHYILNNELFRVCSKNSVLLTSRKEADNLMQSKFLVKVDDEAVYFTKEETEGGQSGTYVYTFEDAVRYFLSKKYEEAGSILHTLMATQGGNNLKYYKLLLLIYIRQDNLYKIQYIEKVFEINRIIHQDIFFIIGSYFFNKSDYSLARNYFERALDVKDNFIFAKYYLALIDKFTGKNLSSIGKFKEIIIHIKNKDVYHPELYSEGLSLEMLEYISENEIMGGGI